MRIYKNEAYIRRRATIGQWAFWTALGALVGGMIVSFRWPQYTFIPLIALAVGFIVAQMSTHYLNRFVRPDRPDISLTAALKGFSNNYALYHYVTPASHVLLSPEGCYVFVVKLQGDRVAIKDGRGYEPITLGRIITLFGRESVGDLAREAQIESDALTRYFAKRLPQAQVTVTPVVVFVHPNVKLDVQSSSVPVMHAKQLKDWLRGPGKVKGLPAQTREQVVNLFGGQESQEAS